MRKGTRTALFTVALCRAAMGAFGQPAEVARFHLNAFPFGTGNIDAPVDMMVDGHGFVWLMDQHAIYCLLNKVPVKIRTLPPNKQVVGWQAVTHDGMTFRTADGPITLATPGWDIDPEGCRLSDPDSLRTLHLPDGRVVHLTDTGSLVIHTAGRKIVQDLTIAHHTNRFALGSGIHGRLLFDPRNGIWVLGRNGLMLASHLKPAFETFDTPVPVGKVAQVVEDPAIDRRFIFSYRTGLLVEEFRTGRLIKWIRRDASGERLIGTKWRRSRDDHFFHGNHCIYRYDRTHDEVITVLDIRDIVTDKRSSLRINDFEVDETGRYFYLGTEDNLLVIFDRLSSRTVMHEVKPPGTFSGINLVVETAPFGNGQALVVAEHGQFLLQGVDKPLRPAQDVWPSLQFGPNFRGSGAKVLGDTLVVISSFTDGLFAYDIPKDSLYRPKGPDIHQLLITDIFHDGLDHIYGTSRSGLLMYNVRDNTLRILKGKQGLPLENLYYRYMRNGAPGEMFLGLTDRYAHFTTAGLVRKATNDLFIAEFQVNGKTVREPPYRELGSTIHLNYLQNSVGVRLATPLVMATPFSSYFVRLEVDGDQVEFLEARHLLQLHALAPGKHRIRLAYTANGPFTDLLTVIISPPIWRSWWFISLSTLGVLAILLVLFRVRLQHVRHEARLKAEYDARIAQLELNSLRAQMHPHFIFNSLNSIKSFIAGNEPRTATRYLNKFSQLIRSILNNSRHARVDLRSELKALELYLELEQMRFEGSFDLSITVAPEIDQDAVTIPPLILQPYAENAIWHGLMHKESDRRLEVYIEQHRGMLLATLRDNGIGRSAAQRRKGRSATKHKSLGMKITSEIIQRTHIDGATGVEIKDLHDAQGKPCGTEVNISIPIAPGA